MKNKKGHIKIIQRRLFEWLCEFCSLWINTQIHCDCFLSAEIKDVSPRFVTRWSHGCRNPKAIEYAPVLQHKHPTFFSNCCGYFNALPVVFNFYWLGLMKLALSWWWFNNQRKVSQSILCDFFFSIKATTLNHFFLKLFFFSFYLVTPSIREHNQPRENNHVCNIRKLFHFHLLSIKEIFNWFDLMNLYSLLKSCNKESKSCFPSVDISFRFYCFTVLHSLHTEYVDNKKLVHEKIFINYMLWYLFFLMKTWVMKS